MDASIYGVSDPGIAIKECAIALCPEVSVGHGPTPPSAIDVKAKQRKNTDRNFLIARAEKYLPESINSANISKSVRYVCKQIINIIAVICKISNFAHRKTDGTMWLIFAFISAAMLGVYDIFKKQALKDNAVIPVLFLNTLFCSLLFLPLIAASRIAPDEMSGTLFYVPQVGLDQHLYIMLKAIIVLTSWIFAYFALKHLPITVAGPIKATQPVLTLLGAMAVFGERLNAYQWTGVAFAVISFFMMSWSGKSEGINFRHNKWIFFMVLATIAGAASGLYDKYLLSHGFDRMTVQVWYTYYQAAMMGLVLVFLWYPARKNTTPFRFTPSIFLVSLFLVVADFIYFYALSYPESMISIVSMSRRSGVIVSFIGGALFFKEKNLKKKSVDLLLVLTGMYFLYLGSR